MTGADRLPARTADAEITLESMALWEKILMGAIGLLVIFMFRPGIKAAFERSKQAENKDWKAVLIPIGLVVLFVIFLLATA